MANTVAWHAKYQIELDLTDEPHLGHPDRPGLLAEVYQPDAHARFEPGILQCPECRDYGDPDCPEWMHLRRAPSGRLHAVHHNKNIKDHDEGESDAHKALKERMATAARNGGLQADIESSGPGGKRRTDVRVRGGVMDLACEAQLSYATKAAVVKRSKQASVDGLTPLWATTRLNAPFLGVAPWATLQKMHWQQFLSKNDLPVLGGARRVEWERCTRGRVCPEEAKKRTCPGWHLRMLARRIQTLDHLIVGAAHGRWVPWADPTSRAANWFWVTSEDLALIGTPPTVPQQWKPPDTGTVTTDEDDNRELDRSCQYGQERAYTPVVPQRLDKPIVLSVQTAPSHQGSPTPMVASPAAPAYGIQVIVQAVDGAHLEAATANMQAFVDDVLAQAALEAETRAEIHGQPGAYTATVGMPVRDETADRDGRFGWILPVNGRNQTILMPGVDLDRLRGMNLSAPCVMVNGSPSWWNTAVSHTVPLPERHRPDRGV